MIKTHSSFLEVTPVRLEPICADCIIVTTCDYTCVVVVAFAYGNKW